MTDEQNPTPENQGAFEAISCMTMMEKMMSGEREGCGCAGMMSQDEDKTDLTD